MDFRPVDDEEDEVVGEIDVFLAQPEDSCELYVLQYPLRNPHVGIGKDRRITGVNVRPKHGRVEVKLAVLPHNPDSEEITSADGCGKSFDTTQDLVEEKDIGEEQCLRSRPNFAAPDSNYAVASFVPAEKSLTGTPALTIVPVRSVAQMRPTFDYLDDYEAEVAKQKAAEKLARASARGLETKQPVQEESEVAPLQVSFRRRETERAAEKRKSSHATLRKREEEEAWVPLDFFPAEDPKAVQEREKLFNSTGSASSAMVKEEAIFDEATTYSDLFRAHTRHVQLGLVAKANIDSQNVSAKALKRLPLESAVAHAITYARVVAFDDLYQLVGEEHPRNQVLDATRSVAACLRGCWVAKKGNKKGLDRMKSASERFEASRILILNLFRQQRVVTESAAVEALGDRVLISEASVRTILEEIAEEKRGQGWEFRLEDDNKFLLEHADVCEIQDSEWERKVEAAKQVLTRKRR